MSAAESRRQISTEGALQLMELAETALVLRSLEELEERVLPSIAGITGARSVSLYIVDPRMTAPYFFQQEVQPEMASTMENLYAEQFDRISSQTDLQPVSVSADLTVYPLRAKDRCIGLIGLTAPDDTSPISPDLLERLFRLLATTISRLAERTQSEKQLAHLNTYLTVSSMLAQSLDLPELLEITLYSCIEAVFAERASVLLLGEEKKHLHFYQVGGPAEPVLEGAAFPADKGVAGSILQTQQSEIINDVPNDSRFYGKIDSETGFQTRNMIALPLVAGEEPVGVLEVLNKADGGPFTEEERLLLVSISEEIAFAIRNAKMFEYVVNTYCKQRQGQMSCRGCKRPLGSWTPCVKYREASII
jgi:GAF domain-containing protein